MKIIFNNDGTLKYVELDQAINQGDNLTKSIDVAVEGRENDTYSMVANFQLPNGDVNSIGSSDVANIVVDGTTYSGRTIRLTSAQTLYSGIVKMSLKLVDLNDEVLYTLQRDLTINPSVYDPDELQITQAQYNSLVSSFAAYQVKYALANVRFYKSLALANADISNLAVDQTVFIKDTNGNLVPYHKVEGEPSLVKFEFADLVQALADISATYLTKAQAQTQYQKKLTAGTNIYIDQETGVISASGGTVIKVDDQTGLPYASENDLPTASAGTMGAIYLVASARPTTENQCDEYITIHNETDDTYKWECIGTTAVDLTNYCTLNTVQTISADKSIAYGKVITFADNNNGNQVDIVHDGNDLTIFGSISQGGTYSNVDDDGNIVSQLGYDVGESGGYVAAFYGIVGIYNTLDSDNNETENSIDFCKADGTLTTQLYADRVEFDIDNTTKTVTWSAIYNAVNNALINGSGTATTVAIGNTLGYPNIAESVLIGVEASAGSSSRTREVTIGYRAGGGTDSVAIGFNTKITNGTKSVVIGASSQLSDQANNGNNVLIGYGVQVTRGTAHTMIGAGTQTTPASESDPAKYADHDIILGDGSGNTLDDNCSIDGPSKNRTMWFRDPTKVLFRNANVDMSKRTQSDYPDLKTLNDYLFGTGVSVTSSNADVTVIYDHIVLGYDGIVRGVLKIEIGNNNVAPNTVIGTISEEPSSDIFLVGSDGDSVFIQFKIDTSGNIIAIDELNNSNTYCLNIVY